MRRALLITISFFIVITLLSGCGRAARRAPQRQGQYKDGTYQETTDPDQRGWVKSIKITVAGGKITEVGYDEKGAETGRSKTEDEEYINTWRTATNTEIDPKETYEALAADLVDKQDPQKVDTITGATSSSNTFKDLANRVLGPARN